MIRAWPGLLVDALFFADQLEQILGNELAELLGYSDVGYLTLGFPQARDRKQPNFHSLWDASRIVEIIGVKRASKLKEVKE